MLLMPDALAFLLCGCKTCEYTEASTTNLLDAEKREWDWELIDGDVERGIYQYETDPDGHGLTLTLTGRGTGMVFVEVKGIVDDAFLCVIVVR